MHKFCVQLVGNPWQSVRTNSVTYPHTPTQTTWPVGKQPVLYTAVRYFFQAVTHSFFGTILSVTEQVLPSFHTTNKSKEQDLFNFLITSNRTRSTV